MSATEPTEEMIAALERAVEATFAEWNRSLQPLLFRGPLRFCLLRRGASLATLRRRARYGGRKGRRAARRLAGR